MPIDEDDADYKERMAEARKHKGLIIKTSYDDKGKPISSEVLNSGRKDGRSITNKIKAIGSRLAVATKGRQLTEEELDRQIRITEKKAQLAKAKRNLADHRREHIRSTIQTFGQFMATDLPGYGKGSKRGGGSSSYNDSFFTANGMDKDGGINPNFDYADWTFGRSNSAGKKKAKRTGNDILKDYYGM